MENCPNGSLSKVAKFHTNPYSFGACLPKPYKLSILGDICRATILPFSSSKYFYSWWRLTNLVDLSFAYLSFSNKRKTTILFPSPLTFLQWPIETLLKCPYTILSQQSIRAAFEWFLDDKPNLSSHVASQGLLDTGIYRGNILPRI